MCMLTGLWDKLSELYRSSSERHGPALAGLWLQAFPSFSVSRMGFLGKILFFRTHCFGLRSLTAEEQDPSIARMSSLVQGFHIRHGCHCLRAVPLVTNFCPFWDRGKICVHLGPTSRQMEGKHFIRICFIHIRAVFSLCFSFAFTSKQSCGKLAGWLLCCSELLKLSKLDWLPVLNQLLSDHLQEIHTLAIIQITQVHLIGKEGRG